MTNFKHLTLNTFTFTRALEIQTSDIRCQYTIHHPMYIYTRIIFLFVGDKIVIEDLLDK